ncbi:MAG: 16S rRNA (guanine(527)-N(7))-methyltransferase RsmG [Bacteroidales bacterium]|nr:16S rRNA (guanine(527)-N(7))-methyltransferase RsmG [Bacteroidales bacterium]
MTYEQFEPYIKEAFPFVSEKQLGQFRALDALYRDWNSKINVISRKDIDSLYLHHVLHSLCIAKYVLGEDLPGWAEDGAAQVLDLGTGGGFPGIPLAILFPHIQFTLCDSVGKKTIVASAVAQALELGNVTVVNDRAEKLPQKFDWVVSRAVTALEGFIPWVKGKYTQGILYLKGGDIAEEIAVAMERHRIPKGRVHTWSIDRWLQDEYFEGKWVIRIEKF